MKHSNEENAGIFCICDIALVKCMLALMRIWIIITLVRCKATRPERGKINQHKIEKKAMLQIVHGSWFYVWVDYLKFINLHWDDVYLKHIQNEIRINYMWGIIVWWLFIFQNFNLNERPSNCDVSSMTHCLIWGKNVTVIYIYI